jgi:hypothetical protein
LSKKFFIFSNFSLFFSVSFFVLKSLGVVFFIGNFSLLFSTLFSLKSFSIFLIGVCWFEISLFFVVEIISVFILFTFSTFTHGMSMKAKIDINSVIHIHQRTNCILVLGIFFNFLSLSIIESHFFSKSDS